MAVFRDEWSPEHVQGRATKPRPQHAPKPCAQNSSISEGDGCEGGLVGQRECRFVCAMAPSHCRLSATAGYLYFATLFCPLPASPLATTFLHPCNCWSPSAFYSSSTALLSCSCILPGLCGNPCPSACQKCGKIKIQNNVVSFTDKIKKCGAALAVRVW